MTEQDRITIYAQRSDGGLAELRRGTLAGLCSLAALNQALAPRAACDRRGVSACDNRGREINFGDHFGDRRFCHQA